MRSSVTTRQPTNAFYIRSPRLQTVARIQIFDTPAARVPLLLAQALVRVGVAIAFGPDSEVKVKSWAASHSAPRLLDFVVRFTEKGGHSMVSRDSCDNPMQSRLSTWYRPIRFLSPTRSSVENQSESRSPMFLVAASLVILVVLSMAGVGFAQEAKTAFPTVEFDIPTEHTSTVGTPVTIEAVFYNNDKPVSGVSMIFEVISGPNAGVLLTATTDRNGHASITYASGQPGKDVVEFGWRCPETGKHWKWDTVAVTWIERPPEPPKCTIPAEAIQPGITEQRGPVRLTTLETSDPIFAGGGEFRQSWSLISLGGPIPLEFALIYAPDLRWRTPTSDGRTQFPPASSVAAFTSNSIIRLAEFEDRTLSPHRTYVNVLLSADTLVFEDDGEDRFVASGPIKLQLQRSGDFYYMMDPIRQLVYIFRSRDVGCSSTEAGRVTQHITRVGEVVHVLDRNGNRLSYTYNHDNLPTRIEDGLGRILEFTYLRSPSIENRHLASVSDGYGRTVAFEYRQTPCGEGEEQVLASFTDPMGHTTRFEYFASSTNECGLLQKVVRPLGNSHFSQTWTRNPHGVYAVDSQEDAHGNKTTLSWEEGADGNLIVTASFPDGTQRVFHHERERYPLRVTDETGRQFSMQYNEHWQRTSLTDRIGDTTSFSYHAETGCVQSIGNANDEGLRFAFVPQDQTFSNPANHEPFTFTFYSMTRVGYPDGTFEALQYDDQGSVTTRTDRAGRTWRYQYNGRGQVTRSTNPSGRTVDYTYNADATLASHVIPETGTTSFSYDRMKRPTHVAPSTGLQAEGGDSEQTEDEGALGALRHFLASSAQEQADDIHPVGVAIGITYDPEDRITSITDERGSTTTYDYDANGNLVRLVDSLGRETQYFYDRMDRVVGRINRQGKSTEYAYDSLGHLASIIDPDGNSTGFAYDPRGWLDEIRIAGQPWQIGYDEEGLPILETTPLGRSTTYERDALGYITSIIDPLAHRTTLTRDSMNRITEIIDPLGRETSYAYDDRGLLTGVSLPGVGSATYERDDRGLMERITDLNGNHWSFRHTETGILRESTDPLGNTWLASYDDRGRLSLRTYPGGGTQTLTYDQVGNVVRRQFSTGADIHYDYDTQNRLTGADGLELILNEEGQVIATDNVGIRFDATYDDSGRLAAVAYADGLFTVTYEYDPSDRLRKVADSLTGTELRFTYDADGRLVGIERPNGVNTELAWDAASRLINVHEGSLGELQYAYNAADEVAQEVRTGDLGNRTICYDYDGAGRLATVDYGDGSRLTYSYDAAGDLLRCTGDTPFEELTDTDESYSYDASCQLVSPGYSYDARGRLAASPDDVYSWDATSRLVRANAVDLTYNGLGDLVTRAEAGTTIHYHYNYAIGLTPIVAERDDTLGQFVRFYVWTPCGSLLYMIDVGDGNKVHYYHFDLSGSTLALTDNEGQTTDTYTYTPYGVLLEHHGTSEQPFTFVGELGVRTEAASSSFYHMRERYYDAVTARFVSHEAVWPILDDPLALNPYQYARQNPMGYVDPLGLLPRFRVPRVKINVKLKPAAGIANFNVEDSGFFERVVYVSVSWLPGGYGLHDMYIQGHEPPQGRLEYLTGELVKDVFTYPFQLTEDFLHIVHDLSWWHVGGREAPAKGAADLAVPTTGIWGRDIGLCERVLWNSAKWITESEILYPGLILGLQKVQEGWKKCGEWYIWTAEQGAEVGRQWGSDVGTFIYGTQAEKVELTQSIYSSNSTLTIIGREAAAAAYTGYSWYYGWAKQKVLDCLR
jgi:RHS repeat-associated protein